MNDYLVKRLLTKGDIVSIENGRLGITPFSGSPVPDVWLQKNESLLVREIAELLGLVTLKYSQFKTGHYPRAGVTLHFMDVISNKNSYTIFNVDLKRARGKNKDKDYPGKQFRVSRHRKFYKFWVRAGMEAPPRLSIFHKYMGHLKKIWLTGRYDPKHPERIIKDTLSPLSVSHKMLTSQAQHSHNIVTNVSHKEVYTGQTKQGFQADQSTCNSRCVNKLISKHDDTEELGDTFKVLPISKLIVIKDSSHEQTIDEWLADYG